MLQAAESAAGSLVVEGVRIDLIERGSGRPLVFLHAENGMMPARAAIDELAKAARVIAPTHPGYGRAEIPHGMRTVDDLSYFYLDFLDRLDLREATVVGVSFGAWIAAAVAVKSTERIEALVLANPVGIKVGGRETRDMPDIFAMLEQEFLALAFADPAAGARDYRAMTADELTVVAGNREAAAVYAWSPYMHDPKLKGRLHRIRIPTLVLWGTADRLLAESYGRAFCAAIPGAAFDSLPGAGHFPHVEKPQAVAERALAFANRGSAAVDKRRSGS